MKRRACDSPPVAQPSPMSVSPQLSCSKCGESRDFFDFAKDSSKASGRKSHCKQCDAAKARRYYAVEENRQRKHAYYIERKTGREEGGVSDFRP